MADHDPTTEHNPAARVWNLAACKKANAECFTYLANKIETRIAFERAEKDYSEEWDIAYDSACKEMRDK